MKYKVRELFGDPLDWAVAKSLNPNWDEPLTDDECYSTNWAQGGPIIEREQIDISFIPTDTDTLGFWAAYAPRPKSHRDYWPRGYGPTPLIAVMRCYVASKLGDEIEIPDEVIQS